MNILKSIGIVGYVIAGIIFCSYLGFPLPVSADTTTSLDHAWKFQETSGNAQDSVGNTSLTNNGTITYSNIYSGGATINTSGQYFSTTSNLSLTNSSDFTIRILFKIPSDNTSDKDFFDIEINGITGSGFRCVYEYNGGARRMRCYRAGISNVFADIAGNLGDNTLHQLVYSYDHTGNREYVWIDGNASTSSATSGSLNNGASNQFNLGGTLQYSFTMPMGGTIANTLFYSRSLSHADVMELWNSGTPLVLPAPPPTSGCLDTRATNYDENALVSSSTSPCVYPTITSTTPYLELPSHPTFTTTIGLPEIYPHSTTSPPFTYAVEVSTSSDAYWYYSDTSTTSLVVNLMYPINSARKYVYLISTFSPSAYLVYTCNSPRTEIGQVIEHGSPYTSPAGATIYTNRININSSYSCFSIETPLVATGEKIFAVYVSTNSSLVSSMTSWASFLNAVTGDGGVTITSTSTTATTTIIYDSSYCNVLNTSSFSINGCVIFLFVPSTNDVSNAMETIKSDLYTRVPFGYVTRMNAIWATTSTTSLPSFTVSVPTSASTHESLSFDMGDMLIGGVNLLNSISSPINGKSVRDVTEPFVKLLIAIAVIFTILSDIMGTHRHNEHRT